MQALGGQRQRATVDRLQHARQQHLASLRERPADHDQRRVEQADARSEHLADVPAGLPHGLARDRAAGPHKGHHVGGVRRVEADGAELRGDGGAAGHGLQRPLLPQRQSTSPACGARMCPRSPAAPVAP
nr:hypothetical protein [Micromonospora kangleipakensis]